MQILVNKGRQAKIWVKDLADIESIAIDQIKRMLQIPTLFGHIAIMPDYHLGKGAVVGSVVATKNTVLPNIVGVDIGCGVSAYNTKIMFDKYQMDRKFWMDFKTRVSRAIPTGFNSFKKKQNLGSLDRKLKSEFVQKFVYEKGAFQLGTLGGGNHFIEVGVDEENTIWLLVHSGSRYTGLQIALFYNNLAYELNQKRKENPPPNLNFLRTNEKEGQDYLSDMNWAIDFALENRWRMLEETAKSFLSSYRKF